MSNPTVVRFGRIYVKYNPDDNAGPDTYRLAINDSIGGGGPGTQYAFDGKDPVDVSVDTTPTIPEVTTSIDYTQLPSRV